MLGKLLDGTKCQILLDTRGRKSFMSKPYHIPSKPLYLLPEFLSKNKEFK